MCRLAAFPPDYPRDKALEILLSFEGKNTDGVGSVHLKNGKFIVEKYPTSLSKVLSKNNDFLGHMPHNGWTLAHLRLASHGCNHERNTHPFIVGDWGFIHNGIWSDYDVVKLALSKSVKFEGETDSEVAGHLWNIIGPEKFAQEIDYGGVFMGLNRNGHLHVAKTSGDLDVFHRKNKTIVLASTLPNHFKRKYESERGWFHYNKDGTYKEHKFKASRFTPSYGNYHSGGTTSYGVGGSQGIGSGTRPTDGTSYPLIVRGKSNFSAMAGADVEEWGEELKKELAEELGIDQEELNGIPTYVPRSSSGITTRDLDDENDWRYR